MIHELLFFVSKIRIKLIYVHLQFLKFSRGFTLRPPLKGRGKEFGKGGGRETSGENGDIG
jgi:hypothetical protein